MKTSFYSLTGVIGLGDAKAVHARLASINGQHTNLLLLTRPVVFVFVCLCLYRPSRETGAATAERSHAGGDGPRGGGHRQTQRGGGINHGDIAQ